MLSVVSCTLILGRWDVTMPSLHMNYTEKRWDISIHVRFVDCVQRAMGANSKCQVCRKPILSRDGDFHLNYSGTSRSSPVWGCWFGLMLFC